MQLPLDDLLPTVPVLVAVPLDGVFDYTVPTDMTLLPGDIVEVPFAGRMVLGCVWGEMKPAGDNPSFKMKSIQQKFPARPLKQSLRTLIEQIAERTLSPRGACLKLVLNVPAALEPEPVKWGYRRQPDIPASLRLTKARQKAIDSIPVDHAICSLAEFAERSGVSQSVIKGLVDAGLFEASPMPIPPLPGPVLDKRIMPALDAQQRYAYETMRDLTEDHPTGIALLAGVTGSGKTFVYAQLVEDVLRQGKQVLILLPEIGLTAQLVERLTTRFGGPPALWHSSQNPILRRKIWRGVADGSVPLVTGARSALFLPFDNLGLIVIDEEHDPSYKQHDGVPYHGRNVALMRSELEDCPVVLSSATPSLEAALQANAFGLGSSKRSDHSLISLADRHGGAKLPHIGVIDLKQDRPARGTFLSPTLQRKMEEHLQRGEQVLLFLNRRGYAPLTVCRGCGHRMQCPNCATWLVHHQIRRRLQCHHCSYAMPMPDYCPSCGTIDNMAGSGPGVERISEEAAKLFPDAKQAIMTSDTIYKAEQAMALNQAMQSGDINLLIGTQLAAKGLHFPNLTLVGVVDGDLGIEGADPRAAERSFQLLWQVAGRAGRANKRGLVLIQTHFPGHPVMNALSQGSFKAFYQTLFAERERAALPPCGGLGALVISGPDLVKARQFAESVVKSFVPQEHVRILGPAPAPIPLMRGRHRLRILVRAQHGVDMASTMSAWLDGIKVPSAIRMQVDPDPYSFF